jgi:maleate cis-trans isomerase
MAHTDCSALLVVPANNTTMEPELKAQCRELSSVSVARVSLPREGVNPENLDDYTRTTLETIEPFVDAHPRLLVYGCTAAGFLAGPKASAELAGQMHRRTGATVVATATAMIDVLRHEGVRETAVVTPYLKPVNDGLRAYLDAAGIGVEVLHSCECATVDELGRVTEQDVYDMAVKTVTPGSKSLFIACSQLPTMGILETLRERFGIPVWSSISATAWASSRAVAELEQETPA